ncbi:MAG: exonuclease [Chloroflexi bacterium RBG_16_56_11]|nr:MAG: exonuclease [Chloroflexi bacterium RBG_16_56_11]
MRPLSFSQISTYRSCPLSYKLQYLEGLKPKDRWYFSFGTTMHSCVEHFFRVDTPPPPSLEDLLGYYEQNWLPQGYASPEEESRYRDFGRDILTQFYEMHRENFRLPVALERNFTIDVEGIKLRGIIDRVDKLESGGLSVVDYKTNRELFTAGYLADDLQLTIYQMAAESIWRLPVEQLTLYHLRSNTACSCPPRSPEIVDQARRIVVDVAEKITRGEFPAIENNFCPCDFPEHCPYYRHRYLTAAPPTVRQELLPGIAAIDAAERYADLQTRIKELQAQLEEARQALVQYCQDESLNRVFANTCDITYKLVERTGFGEEEVRALLEPEGLWEKVLSLDPARIKQLLADESIDITLRNKLESLRRLMSTYPQLWVRRLGGDED